MGLLNTKDVEQLPAFADNQQFPGHPDGLLPGGRMYVYEQNSVTLSPVYRDRDLTTMIANPVMATPAGRFPLCYLVDGRYRVEFRDRNDALVLSINDVAVADDVSLGSIFDVADVDELLNDRTLSYSADPEYQQVKVGQVLRVAEDNHLFTCMPEDSENYHLMTRGGVKLTYRARVINAEAFGVKPSGTADNTEAWDRLWAAVAEMVEGNNLGGPPTVLLPRGIIRVSSTATLPRGVTVIGQGAGKEIFNAADGTWVVATGTEPLFYTGFPLNTDAGKCIGVELRNFSMQRDAAIAETPSENGLIHGHQAIEWRVTNVRMNGGHTPCINLTNAWDCQWTQVTFTGGGVPDGTACVNIRNSTASTKNSNYNQFLQCRWEDIDGPMMKMEGLHHSVIQSKFHAISNHKGTLPLPAIELSDSTVFVGNGLANHSGPVAAATCSTYLRLINGECYIAGNIFRNNDGISPIEITGSNTFAGGHIISGNVYDGYVHPAIRDTRTVGKPLTLGPAEWAVYQGAPTGVPSPNATHRVVAGGKPKYAEGRSYFEQDSDNKGPALHALYSLGYGSGVGDVAALIQSGSYQRPVAIVEQTRTSGNTSTELQIRTGKASTDGKNFVEGVSEAAGAAVTRFAIRHDGAYLVGNTKVVGTQQAAIADSAGGDEVSKINAILAALRGHGLIAT
ncbi:glycosyl hydrolase family 28-related protein [Sagittula sp.]|uniref:glycosyl hydrolase family 28-related protein n=1 Tax=Sagittula sp. TaxID=2038081 RepID=UPI00351477B8